MTFAAMSTPLQIPGNLHAGTKPLVAKIQEQIDLLRGTRHSPPSGGTVIDLGVKAEGGLQAGRLLAEVCLAGLGTVVLATGELSGRNWPQVQVQTDFPVAACLASQYAGWQLSCGKFFGMGSGPMRAVSAREELFQKLNYRETTEETFGVIETGKLPADEVFQLISEKTNIAPDRITLLVARTASAAGNLQVVARSVETAMHKLLELGFDVSRVRSGFGVAPLPPIAPEDLTGIGWTNDSILYGGRVTLWVTGDDDTLADIGPKVPANSSAAFGKPFLEIFEEAGKDFYKIDPHLFSPAEVVFHNLQTGRTHAFGTTRPDILNRSYGVK